MQRIFMLSSFYACVWGGVRNHRLVEEIFRSQLQKDGGRTPHVGFLHMAM